MYHLLLDTSFFIDAREDPSVFIDFLNKCRESKITLVTIDPVVLEFLKGARSSHERAKRLSFIKSFAEFILPIPGNVYEVYLDQVVESYGQRGAGVSLTDFMLAAMTMHHKHDLCLFTKNTKHFSVPLFDLQSYCLLQNKKQNTLQVYGIYSYKFEEPEEDVVPF